MQQLSVSPRSSGAFFLRDALIMVVWLAGPPAQITSRRISVFMLISTGNIRLGVPPWSLTVDTEIKVKLIPRKYFFAFAFVFIFLLY